jgi:hypothetical protein
MARCLLAGKAVAGIVDAVDREHREVVTTNRARRRAAGPGYSALILGRRRGHRPVAAAGMTRPEIRRDAVRIDAA